VLKASEHPSKKKKKKKKKKRKRQNAVYVVAYFST
jgi:hypothetical protein